MSYSPLLSCYQLTENVRGKGGSPDNLPPLDELLPRYYRYRGWDEMGIPKREKLFELGIEQEASFLEKPKRNAGTIP